MDCQQAGGEPAHDKHDGIRDIEPFDLPPSYDTLSLRYSASRRARRHDSTSASYAGLGSNNDIVNNSRASSEQPSANVNKSLPPRPSSVDFASLSQNGGSALAQVPRARKNFSWLSLLPFASSLSTRRVRRSVLSAVHDLVIQPSRRSDSELKNVHGLLDSMAESCVEHELSLSAILQERSIADHTPMYWVIVNYREELLVALLIHSQPLSIQTISDIRRACLASSNQTLFHALRVCRPPFHRTSGLHVSRPQAPSDNLLLGFRPVDEIDVQRSTDKGFIVTFEIHFWQRRMNVIGHASIEFIAAGRMWSVTFFSTLPSSLPAKSGKRKKGANTWHVMVRLLESSLPTFFDSQIVIGTLPLSVSESNQTQTLRGSRSATLLRSNQAEIAYTGSEQHKSLSSSWLPPPIHPLRSSPSSPLLMPARQPTIRIDLSSGDRKLGCRLGEPSKLAETLTTKSDKWSDHGVGYTSAVVSPLGEDTMSRLLHDHSPYLSDGTLRGRLEARFVKSGSANCVIC